MGKRKGTSAAKKRDRRDQRQKVPLQSYPFRPFKGRNMLCFTVFVWQDIRAGQVEVNLKKEYCNSEMVCDSCQNKQKNRAFCYFCSAVQRLPQCAECGRTKCMVADCTVSHAGKSATGLLSSVHPHTSAYFLLVVSPAASCNRDYRKQAQVY